MSHTDTSNSRAISVSQNRLCVVTFYIGCSRLNKFHRQSQSILSLTTYSHTHSLVNVNINYIMVTEYVASQNSRAISVSQNRLCVVTFYIGSQG